MTTSHIVAAMTALKAEDALVGGVESVISTG